MSYVEDEEFDEDEGDPYLIEIEDSEEGDWARRVERFADPGGTSNLYPASSDNPRDQPCPQCGREEVLTPLDIAARYVCDSCANGREF